MRAWALMLVTVGALLSGVPGGAEVIYEHGFEDTEASGWAIPDNRADATSVMVVGADVVEPFEGQRCLQMVGTRMWNICELTLEEPVTLDEPVWLSAAWRGEGPVGQMNLMLVIEGEARPAYSLNGPVGRESVGRWDRLVARLDQFGADYAGGKLLGVRIAARCEVGAELPDGLSPEYSVFLDDLRIATGADAEPARALVAEHAAPREYAGEQRFILHRSDGVTLWHTPGIAPAMEDSAPPEATGERVRLRLAAGEAESFELVATIEAEGATVVTVEAGALAGPDGATIPAEALYWHPVRFVPLVMRLGFPMEVRWPDPLSWDREVIVDGKGGAHMWVTVMSPHDAPPGVYSGEVAMRLSGAVQRTVMVPLEVEVLPFALPVSPTFRTNQQLWGPKEGVGPTPWLEELGKRKQYDANMWYSSLEERIWRIEELGQNAIKINGVGGHGPKPVNYGDAEIGTEEHREAYVEHVARNVAWVRENGWEDRAFVYIWDENWGSVEVFDHVKYLAGLIRGITEDIPILGALPVNERIEGVVNIYLAEYSPPGTIQRRLAEGDEFWRWGNVDLQLGKAPLSARMSYGFESVCRHFTGAYSWGINAWREEDPWVDHHRDNWSATAFYPGVREGSQSERPVPSIRLEMLRDGIEDYEYVAILRGLIEACDDEAEAARAREVIARAEALSERENAFRRLDEQIDEMADLRQELQDAIVRLNGDGKG